MDKNRLIWASRRGMLELDLILAPFVENVYPNLPQEEKELYWKLLDAEDLDIFGWLLRRESSEDPELQRIVEVIRANTGMEVENPSKEPIAKDQWPDRHV